MIPVAVVGALATVGVRVFGGLTNRSPLSQYTRLNTEPI
jgi:hypothetical protein